MKRTFKILQKNGPANLNIDDQVIIVVRPLHFINDNNSLVGEGRAPGDHDIAVLDDDLDLNVPDDMINTPMRTPG